jgi:phosphosulfolactate phosphohydrolase-like enzyme
MDDRFSDDEVNHSHESVDDAQFAGFLAQHIFDTMDEESRLEAEERMESTVEFWDSLAECA